MLSIVDLVVSYNGAAVGSDLNSRQGVTIDIVTLYQTPSISKYVHPSLVTVEYSISPGYKKKGKIQSQSWNKHAHVDIKFPTQPCILPHQLGLSIDLNI